MSFLENYVELLRAKSVICKKVYFNKGTQGYKAYKGIF